MVCTVTSCPASAPVVYKSACTAVCPNQYYSLKKKNCIFITFLILVPHFEPVLPPVAICTPCTDPGASSCPGNVPKSWYVTPFSLSQNL